MKHINSPVIPPVPPRWFAIHGLMRTAVVLGFLTCLIAGPSARAQESTTEERIIVLGDDIGSAYGAPGAFSRTRFAPLTTAYVLPPWNFYFGSIYEGNAFREGLPDHMFTQEM